MTEYKEYEIEIEQDEDAPNPRQDYDNLGVMVCWHDRYDLGDVKSDYQTDPDSFVECQEHRPDAAAVLV
jgi:hypothetical protein